MHQLLKKKIQTKQDAEQMSGAITICYPSTPIENSGSIAL